MLWFSRNVEPITLPIYVNKCFKYGISLNPRKHIFAVIEGKILVYIISKDGIVVNPKRLDPITSIMYPNNKRTMHSFLGNINFICRFILGFAYIVKPLQNMIKKDAIFKWKKEGKEGFLKIKEAITEALTLRRLNFEKEFIIYTFASNTSYAMILTQKIDKADEFLVSFMSFNLQGVELKYQNVEKQGFAVFKVIKHFRPYILKSQTKVIVPHLVVRYLFFQKEMGERRENCMMTL